jgi:hypothetical protein
MGQRQPIDVELPFSKIEDSMSEASRSRFIIGHSMAENGDGVCRRLMISTCRIERVVEME